jgi:hypothetical protein
MPAEKSRNMPGRYDWLQIDDLRKSSTGHMLDRKVSLRLTHQFEEESEGSQMADLYGVVGIRLKDKNGQIVSHEFFARFPDTDTLAQIQTDLQAYCVLLDPMTDCAGVKGHFIVDFPSTGLKTSPSVKNPLSYGGLVDFGDGTTPYKASILVPGIAEALTTTGKIDITDADFIAWQTWLRTGTSHVYPVSKAKNALTGFLSCKCVTRKHRKGLSQLTTQPGT